MNIINSDNHTLIEINSDDSCELIINFLNKESTQDLHIIINLSDVINYDLLVKNLLTFSLNWEKRNKSFILVSSNIIKKHAKGLVVIKTLEEALDFFHMEELMRTIQ